MGLECSNQLWLNLKDCREVGIPIGSLMSSHMLHSYRSEKLLAFQMVL